MHQALHDEGRAEPEGLAPAAPGQTIRRVEDGFLRSRGLGAELVPPLSLVADRLWLVKDGRVAPFDGDLEAYRRMLLGQDGGRTDKPAKKPRAWSRDEVLALRAEVRKCEARVEKIEEMRDKLSARLADPTLYEDGRAGELARELTLIQPGKKLVYAADMADTPLNRQKVIDLARGARRARQNLEADVEVDQRRSDLRKNINVTLRSRGAVLYRRRKALDAHHNVLEVRTVDRDRQIRILVQEAFNIRKRRVRQLYRELLAVVRRDQVHRVRPDAFSLLAVHADADEVEEQLGRHRADHVGTGRFRRVTLGDARTQLESAGQEAVPESRVFLLVADLLPDVGEQVLGFLVFGLRPDQLVENLLRMAVLAFLEQLEADPARFLPEVEEGDLSSDTVAIDLNQPMEAIRAELADRS